MSTAEEGWREGQAGDVGRTSLEDVILETRIQLSHLQKRLEEEADRLQQERRQVEEERARMAAEREAMQKEREAIEQERQAMRFQVKEYEAVIKELQKMNSEGGAPAQRPPSVKRPRAGSSSSSLGAGSSSSSSPGAAQTTPGYRRAKKHQQMLQAEGMPVVDEEQACEAYMGYLFDLTCIVTAKAVYEAFSCLLKPSRWDDAPQQERQKFQAQFMDIDKYGKKQDDWFLLHLKYIFKEVGGRGSQGRRGRGMREKVPIACQLTRPRPPCDGTVSRCARARRRSCGLATAATTTRRPCSRGRPTTWPRSRRQSGLARPVGGSSVGRRTMTTRTARTTRKTMTMRRTTWGCWRELCVSLRASSTPSTCLRSG